MAEIKNNKPKIKGVDDAGIRLAPTPIHNSAYHVMPTIVQEYVIEPQIVTNEPAGDDALAAEHSTKDDFQPKKEDANKKWKRGKRARNMITGSIVFLVSLVVILPYVLSAVKVNIDASFVLASDKMNVIGHFVGAFETSAELGWQGEAVLLIWKCMIPDIILTIGILAVLFNVIKSIFAIFGAVKQIHYIIESIVYLLCVLCIFIAALVGAEAIGIEKIDFVKDFIQGYKTCYLFTMLVFGAGYVLVSALCCVINRDKYGYLK